MLAIMFTLTFIIFLISVAFEIFYEVLLDNYYLVKKLIVIAEATT
ncbi:hypothetical protein G5S33_02508 [Staphylococcus cohnii subsp. cohnii]|nr:hypothetical protein [Staphylococcus cohnii subsp. barensis]